MDPLFPVSESASKNKPAWLSVGSSFPDSPTKRMRTTDFFETAEDISVLQPKKHHKKHKSGHGHKEAAVEPESLSNYKEYEVLDSLGVIQVLRWRLDFGNKELLEFGSLAGFEVPRYDRGTDQLVVGKLHCSTDITLVKELSKYLGRTPKPEVRCPRYYDAKRTPKPLFIPLRESNLMSDFLPLISAEEPIDQFLSRTRELNTHLTANPTDVQAWLTLVDLQTSSVTGKKAQHQVLEKQMAIIDKALVAVHSAVSEYDLRRLLRRLAVGQSDTVEVPFDKFTGMYPTYFSMWKYCVYYSLNRFETFTVSQMRERFSHLFVILNKMSEDNEQLQKVKLWLLGELMDYEKLVQDM